MYLQIVDCFLTVLAWVLGIIRFYVWVSRARSFMHLQIGDLFLAVLGWVCGSLSFPLPTVHLYMFMFIMNR